MALAEVVAYLTAAKTTLDILKGVQSELPKGEKADKAQEQITKAESSLKQSEAEVAKALGFRLCRCEFPPNIMLWDKDQRVSICPVCGDHFPPRTEVNRQAGSWGTSRRG